MSSSSSFSSSSTMTTTPPSKSHKSSGGDDKLIALVVLVIPLAILIYLGWRLYRHLRFRKLAAEVQLNGARKPGEVDDKEMGDALGNASWLNRRGGADKDGDGNADASLREEKSGGGGSSNDAQQPATALGKGDGSLRGIMGGLRLTPTTTGGEFDPIAAQAETQRQRKARRRQIVFVDKDEEFSPAEGGDERGDALDDDDDDDSDQPIFASTMSPSLMQFADASLNVTHTMSGLFTSSHSAPPDSTSPKVTAMLRSSTNGTAIVIPKHYDPKKFSTTTQVLMNKYVDSPLTPPAVGAGSPLGSAFARKKNAAASWRQESGINFETILSVAGASHSVSMPVFKRPSSVMMLDSEAELPDEEEEEERDNGEEEDDDEELEEHDEEESAFA